eukprot:gene28095-31203_t
MVYDGLVAGAGCSQEAWAHAEYGALQLVDGEAEVLWQALALVRKPGHMLSTEPWCLLMERLRALKVSEGFVTGAGSSQEAWAHAEYRALKLADGESESEALMVYDGLVAGDGCSQEAWAHAEYGALKLADGEAEAMAVVRKPGPMPSTEPCSLQMERLR